MENVKPILNKHFVDSLTAPNIELVNLATASAFKCGCILGGIVGLVVGAIAGYCI